jgi:hypothetical protein
VTSDEGSPVRPGNKPFALAIRSRLSARQSEVRSNSLASSSQDAASREKRNLSAASWDRFCYFHAKILAFAANQNAFIHSIEYVPAVTAAFLIVPTSDNAWVGSQRLCQSAGGAGSCFSGRITFQLDDQSAEQRRPWPWNGRATGPE